MIYQSWIIDILSRPGWASSPFLPHLLPPLQPSLPPSPSPGALSFRRTKPTGLTREEGKLEDIGNSCGHNYLPACPARGPGSTLVLKLYSSQVALGKVPHDIENLVCKSTVLLENPFYSSSMACRVFGQHVCILHCC